MTFEVYQTVREFTYNCFHQNFQWVESTTACVDGKASNLNYVLTSCVKYLSLYSDRPQTIETSTYRVNGNYCLSLLIHTIEKPPLPHDFEEEHAALQAVIEQFMTLLDGHAHWVETPDHYGWQLVFPTARPVDA